MNNNNKNTERKNTESALDIKISSNSQVPDSYSRI